MKTKTKRVLAYIALWALLSLNIWTSLAATQIGTGSVTWDAWFDSAIIWDDSFPWTASWSVSWIVVTATVDPTLNMTISTGAIDLWTLNTATYSTWTLDIEIWTNAVNWVTVTARSSSWWLANVTDNSIIINDDTQVGFQDWIAESYRFASAMNAATDSSFAGITQTANLSSEINENTTEHTVYTSDKPEQDDGVNDVTFSVSAKSNAQTPAWSYQDTITFTVTGNF